MFMSSTEISCVGEARAMSDNSIFSSLKWLYPGMRVKRWLLLIPVGMIAIITGVVLLLNMSLVDVLGIMSRKAFDWFGAYLTEPSTQIPVGLALVLFGLFLIFASLRQVVRSIMNAVNPEMEGKLADMVYQRRHLAQGQRIVVIGGGDRPVDDAQRFEAVFQQYRRCRYCN